jgi:hypothetical protein
MFNIAKCTWDTFFLKILNIMQCTWNYWFSHVSFPYTVIAFLVTKYFSNLNHSKAVKLRFITFLTQKINIYICIKLNFLFSEEGRQTVFKSPQVANQNILRLVPQLQLRKFLTYEYASPQIANPQIFMIYLQIANMQIYTKYCITLFQNSPKSRLFHGSCVMYKFKLEYCMQFVWGEIVCTVFADLWKFWVRKSQKRIGPKIANPQSAIFAEGPQM